MNIQHRISRSPIFLLLVIAGLWLWAGPTRVAAAAAPAADEAVEDSAVDAALKVLQGSHGLEMEEPAAPSAKGKTPSPKGEAKSEFEETDAEREEREEAERAEREKREKEKKAGEADAGGDPSEAELEIEAFTQKVSDLEQKLADAGDDEKATVAAELAAAKEGLELWQGELAKETTAERPEFSAEQETFVKAVEAKTEELTTKLQATEARVTELEGQLSQASEAPLGVQEIHPLMYTEKAEDIEATEAHLRAFEKWAVANWDGTEETTDAKGKVTPAYPKEAIRARYTEMKETREKFIPMARQLAATRAQGEQASRKLYPELFDPKRAEGKIAQNLLQRAPVLKAILGPNVWTIIGDAIAGERLRVAQAKKLPSARTPAGGSGAAGRKPLPRAAKGGGGASGGLARAAAAGKGKKGSEPVVDMSAFMNGGGDRAALIKSLS